MAIAVDQAAQKGNARAGKRRHVNGRAMSERDLLRMPQSDYMNQTQLDFFRARLEATRQDILDRARQTTEAIREDTVVTPDPVDRATLEEEHALELRVRDRERKLLVNVEDALRRIDAGDYGYCEETGEPIGLPRLFARPTATLTVEAQERYERRERGSGH